MSLLNTPTALDTYVLPADAAAAKAALLALLNGAASKIRLAMYTLTDPALIAALIAAQTRGVANIMIVLDWSQSHMHWEHMAISVLRSTLTPAKVVYTTSPMHSMIMHNKICVVDDTTTVTGSTNWTTEGWMEANTFNVVRDATLSTMNSAAIDAMAAYGLAHVPQT